MFCRKTLHPEDGLPTETGWLPSVPVRPTKTKETDENNGDQDDEMGEKSDAVEESGKWVHWHPSCSSS